MSWPHTGRLGMTRLEITMSCHRLGVMRHWDEGPGTCRGAWWACVRYQFVEAISTDNIVSTIGADHLHLSRVLWLVLKLSLDLLQVQLKLLLSTLEILLLLLHICLFAMDHLLKTSHRV